MEREAKMRAIVRKAKEPGGLDFSSQSKTDLTNDKVPFMDSKCDLFDTAEEKAVVKRPMWALTEHQAEEAAKRAENDDADDLLDFANGLDFDKYINDSEVSALIENVRSRITELEANQDAETKSELAALERSINNTLGRSRMLTAENLHSLADQNKEVGSHDEDVMSVARSVLESNAGKTMGAIHSHKSLSAVAERSKSVFEGTLGIVSEDAIAPPLVMKHTDDAGARLEGKNCVSNLPYMHRNPAV